MNEEERIAEGTKEEAYRLYLKFFNYNRDNELESCVNDPGWHAVNQAVMCVEEIITACDYNQVESWNRDWWNKVIEELKKI